MEHLYLIANWADYAAELLLMVAATVAAVRWGGPAARIAAAVNVIACVLTTPAALMPGDETLRMWVICGLYILTAAGFLYAAARFNSLWISIAVLAQGTQLGIDVFFIGQASSFDRLHHFLLGAAENAFTWVIQIAILGAALADRRRRLALQGAVRV